MNQTHYSLKKRLLLWISIPVLITGFLVALLSFLFSWHEITEVYDAQMAHSARVLIDLTEDDIQNSDYRLKHSQSRDADIQHRYERKTGYRLWYHDELVIESFRAREFGDFRAPEGFSNQRLKDKPWRFFVYKDPTTGMTVEISQRYAIRYELINQLMLSLLIPGLFFVPVILVLIWFATSKSLRPLIQLSDAVDIRHSDDLTPIEISYLPREAVPLVHAMNRLFKRIHESFVREREFTDHAAHELRTPLAAMKTQTQVLMKRSGDISEYSEDLSNLHATINRSTHLVEQLLSLARLQNETLPMDKVDLSEIVQDVAADVNLQARAKNQTLTLQIQDHVYISGHADSLIIMIRNFLDNAIKYTPRNGSIAVDLDDNAILQISDTGPGIPDAQKTKAFERFTRLDKTGEIGSGLGLAIAQWIANTHQAQIALKDNQPHGLVVELKFNNG